MKGDETMDKDNETLDDNLHYIEEIIIINTVRKDYEGMGDSLSDEGIL